MLAVILGVIFVVAGTMGVYVWKGEFLLVMKGLMPFMLGVGGAISIVAGLTSLIESLETKEEGAASSTENKPK